MSVSLDTFNSKIQQLRTDMGEFRTGSGTLARRIFQNHVVGAEIDSRFYSEEVLRGEKFERNLRELTAGCALAVIFTIGASIAWGALTHSYMLPVTVGAGAIGLIVSGGYMIVKIMKRHNDEEKISGEEVFRIINKIEDTGHRNLKPNYSLPKSFR
jgi:hypothetical protein